ncbi:MAG: GspH/FimT family pseudopilin [Oleiphilus sp.]
MLFQNKQSGFSLIELMVVLTIVGIFAMVAVPSYQSTIQNGRLTSETNELIGALYYARSEAVKRRADVQVCKSDDGITCDPGLNWQDGWLVWSDADGDSAVDQAEVLRVGTEAEGQISIFATMNDVTFSLRGMSSISGTLQLCDSRGVNEATAIVISPSGRVRSSDTTHIGGDLTCS